MSLLDDINAGLREKEQPQPPPDNLFGDRMVDPFYKVQPTSPGLKPSHDYESLLSGIYGEPTGTQYTGYDPTKELIIDPIFWLGRQINRGQQALFGAVKETQDKGITGIGTGFWGGLVQGKQYPLKEILLDFGMQDQAGHWDWIDTLSVVGEIGLDPINFASIGGKVGKVGKLGMLDEAARGVEALRDLTGATADIGAQLGKTLGQAEMGADVVKLAARTTTLPGDLGQQVLKYADNMKPPPDYSHFLRFGLGKNQYYVPGSQYVLETAFITPGKWLRKNVFPMMSTIPEGTGALISKASEKVAANNYAAQLKIIDDMRYGTHKAMKGQEITNPDVVTLLKAKVDAGETPMGAVDSYIGNMIERTDVRLDTLEGVPQPILDAIEVGRFYGRVVPKLENLSGTATRELMGRSLLDNTMEGLGVNTEEATGYLKHIVSKDVIDYKFANDIRYRKGFFGVGAKKPYTTSNFFRELDGTITSINKEMAEAGVFTLHPKGPLLTLWKQGGKWPDLIEDTAKLMGKKNKGLLEAGSDVADRFIDNVAQLKEVLGVDDVGKLFKEGTDGTFHYQKFDKFFIDDVWQSLAQRVSQSYRARTFAETMHVAANWPSDLSKGERIAIKVEGLLDDATAKYPGYRALNIPQKTLKYMTPELKREIAGEIVDGKLVGGTLFTDEAAKALETGLLKMFDPEEMTKAAKIVKQYLGYYRAGTILPFAGYHINNKAGNLWWRYVQGTLDPRYFDIEFKAKAILGRGDPTELAKPIKGLLVHRAGIKKPDGSLFTYGDLYSEVTSHNVMKGGKIFTEIFADPKQATNFLNKISREGSTLGKTGELLNPMGRKSIGARVARWMEDEDRLGDFIQRRFKFGDDATKASIGTDTTLFDYANLSKFEMETMRNINMFYTWHRKNLGLTLQKMWEYPARITMPVKIKNALNGVFGNPDSEYEVPSWTLDRITYYLGKDNEEGKPVTFDPSNLMPPLSAGQLASDILSFGGKGDIISMLIPLLQEPIKRATGIEPFSGREIAGAPGEKKPLFGQYVPPALFNATKNFRILSTLNKVLWPEHGEGEDRLKVGEPGERPAKAFGRALVRDWGGLKAYATEPQRERYFKAYGMSSEIEEKLGKISGRLMGKISPMQRESYLQERTELLWDKANVLVEMVDDGTDPHTGKEFTWAPRLKDGEMPEFSGRKLYGELQSTLRDLYFGEPPLPTSMV